MMSKAKSVFYWLGASAIGVGVVLLYEGCWFALVKAIGFYHTAVIRTAVTLPLAWVVIYLASRTEKNAKFQAWLIEKESSLSGQAKAIIGGGKAVVIVNTAIFLGPVVASVLMLMVGLGGKRIYLYSALCSVLAAGVWCGFSSGVLWTAGKAALSVP